jgi:RimJ/RimL family protein N-acetyltransferase
VDFIKVDSKVSFEIYNFYRMKAHVFENNIARCKVLEKCNFILEEKRIKNY